MSRSAPHKALIELFRWGPQLAGAVAPGLRHTAGPVVQLAAPATGAPPLELRADRVLRAGEGDDALGIVRRSMTEQAHRARQGAPPLPCLGPTVARALAPQSSPPPPRWAFLRPIRRLPSMRRRIDARVGRVGRRGGWTACRRSSLAAMRS